jgi:hypothetical protein
MILKRLIYHVNAISPTNNAENRRKARKAKDLRRVTIISGSLKLT